MEMDLHEQLLRLPVPVLPSLGRARDGLDKLALSTAELTAASARVAPNPTKKQKESGNYAKGHVTWKGLGVTIETAKGQKRRGVGKDGTSWEITLKDAYGYFKRTESDADGDHIDVFVCDDNLDSELVHVVNQLTEAGAFDEAKCIVGCVDEEAARECYLRNYSPGWKGLGSVAALTLDQFKWWLQNGDTSKPIKDGYFAAPANRKKAAGDEVPFTVAVDLDGTILTKADPPEFGRLRPHAKAVLARLKDKGCRLIIFTVRGDTAAVKAKLDELGVAFDHVNENPDQPKDGSGKVLADVYLDDRAIDAQAHWLEIEKAVEDRMDKTSAAQQPIAIHVHITNPQPAAEVRVDAPNVHVAAPNVTVTNDVKAAEALAPIVNVHVPEQPAPVVHVAAPALPPPTVVKEAAAPVEFDIVPVRDSTGLVIKYERVKKDGA